MINEEYWNRDLNLYELPKFQCPNCDNGLLIIEENKKIQEYTERSSRGFDGDWRP